MANLQDDEEAIFGTDRPDPNEGPSKGAHLEEEEEEEDEEDEEDEDEEDEDDDEVRRDPFHQLSFIHSHVEIEEPSLMSCTSLHRKRMAEANPGCEITLTTCLNAPKELNCTFDRNGARGRETNILMILLMSTMKRRRKKKKRTA
jgi:hypothetical protein